MATAEVATRLVRITGQDQILVERLRDPLTRALGDRRAVYMVDVDTVGRVGQVLVSISGSHGCLPLFFQPEELEAGYVFRVVKDTVARFDF
jgi:hypothetical protein